LGHIVLFRTIILFLLSSISDLSAAGSYDPREEKLFGRGYLLQLLSSCFGTTSEISVDEKSRRVSLHLHRYAPLFRIPIADTRSSARHPESAVASSVRFAMPLKKFDSEKLNSPDSFGNCAIHYLAMTPINGAADHKSMTELVYMFLAYGARVNQRNTSGLSPLRLAAYYGNCAFVSVLLESQRFKKDTEVLGLMFSPEWDISTVDPTLIVAYGRLRILNSIVPIWFPDVSRERLDRIEASQDIAMSLIFEEVEGDDEMTRKIIALKSAFTTIHGVIDGILRERAAPREEIWRRLKLLYPISEGDGSSDVGESREEQ
jgi:hypothetical protein